MDIDIIVAVHESGRWAASGSGDFCNDLEDAMDRLGCPYAGEVVFHNVKATIPDFNVFSSSIEGESSEKEFTTESKDQLFEDYPDYG